MFVHFENGGLHVVICSIKLVQPLQSYDHLMSKNRSGKFIFRDFLGKMECETQGFYSHLNNFLATKIVLAKRASGQ